MTDLPATPIGLDDLPESHRARAEAELVDGERLLWAARPDPKRPGVPKRQRAASLVWTLAWTALAVGLLPLSLWQSSRIDFGANGNPWILGIVFGVLALVIAFFRWVAFLAALVQFGPSRRREANEFYALTDRRVLIWKPMPGSPAVSLIQITPRSVRPAAIERIEYPDGSGNISFSPYRDPEGAIRGIANVRQVDILVRRVLVDATAPPLCTDPDDPEAPV